MAHTRSPNAKAPTKPEDLQQPFFNAAEVAWLMDISVKTVYRRVAAGYPCSRIGTGPVKVSQADLQVWYELNRGGTAVLRTKKRPARRQLAPAA